MPPVSLRRGLHRAGHRLAGPLARMPGAGVPRRGWGVLRDLRGAGLGLWASHHLPVAPPGAGGVTACWLGTAGIALHDGTTGLLLDPFVSRPGVLRVGLGRPVAPDEAQVASWLRHLAMDPVAAVMVSHSHYDHALDAPVFALRTGAVVLGSESTAWLARGAGLQEARIKVVVPGRPERFGAFEVTFLESEHPAALLGRVLIGSLRKVL